MLTKAPQAELSAHDCRPHKTKARVNRAVSYVALVDHAVQLWADPTVETATVLADLHFLFTRDPTRNRKGRKFERKPLNHSAHLRFHRYKKRICAYLNLIALKRADPKHECCLTVLWTPLYYLHCSSGSFVENAPFPSLPRQNDLPHQYGIFNKGLKA